MLALSPCFDTAQSMLTLCSQSKPLSSPWGLHGLQLEGLWDALMAAQPMQVVPAPKAARVHQALCMLRDCSLLLSNSSFSPCTLCRTATQGIRARALCGVGGSSPTALQLRCCTPTPFAGFVCHRNSSSVGK